MKSKKDVEKTETSVIKEVSFTKVGKSYYDVVDVLENKINSLIIEKFSDSVKKEVLEDIVKCIRGETTSAKSWGIDQIRKHF